MKRFHPIKWFRWIGSNHPCMNNDLFTVSHKQRKHSSVMVRVADCIGDELMYQHWRIKGVGTKNAHAVFGEKFGLMKGWRPPGVGTIPLYTWEILDPSLTSAINQTTSVAALRVDHRTPLTRNFRNLKLKYIVGARSLGWCLLLRETLNPSLNLYGNLPSGNSSLFSVLEFKTWGPSFLKNFSDACSSSIFETSV